ncbi:MAG: hypothetical protein ACXWQO_17030 [Bdellovibrionota bacterium]
MNTKLAIIALATLPLSLSALAQPAPAAEGASFEKASALNGTALDAMEEGAFKKCVPHAKACILQVLTKAQASQVLIPASVLAVHSALGA